MGSAYFSMVPVYQIFFIEIPVPILSGLFRQIGFWFEGSLSRFPTVRTGFGFCSYPHMLKGLNFTEGFPILFAPLVVFKPLLPFYNNEFIFCSG